MPLNIVVTNAGRAAIVNAQNTGTAPVTITQIGLSQTAIVPLATDTGLTGEFKRIAGVAGEVVADDTIHLTMTDDSADAYTLRSIGLYLADGTLFAIYGQAGAVLEKTASSIAALSVDVIFADISAAALTFGNANFTNPPATTERQGVVELATTAEAQAGIDALRALTPAAAKAAILGWLLAQDGAGSGLDADLLDGQDGSYYTNIPSRLGYTPVRQGGGAGQGGNSVFIGWSGSRLKAQVDGTDQGNIVFDVHIADVWRSSNDGAGSGLDADLLRGKTIGTIGSAIPLLDGSNSWSGVQAFSAMMKAEQIAFPWTGAVEALVYRSATGALTISTNRQSPGNERYFTFAADGGLGMNGTPFWSAANDGAGSGLDADLLDGQDGSYYSNIVARLGYTPANKAGDTFSGPIRRDSGFSMDLSGGKPMLFFADDGGGADRLEFDRATNTFVFNLAGVDVARFSGVGLNVPVGDILIGRTSLAYGYLIRPNVAGYKNLQFAVEGGGPLDNLELNSLSVTIRGNVAWHSGNDGAGSGLDADLLDGQDGSYYSNIVARLGYTPVNRAGDTMSGALSVPSLVVPGGAGTNGLSGGNGDGASYSTYNLLMNVHWGLGIKTYDGTVNGFYDAREGRWDVKTGYRVNGVDVWHGGNDGAGSGLDADLLDGLNSTAFARRDGALNTAQDAAITVAGGAANDDVWSAPLQIREVNYVGNGQTGTAYAPALNFHWSNVAAGAIKMTSDGSFRFRAQSTDPNAYRPVYADRFYANNNLVWNTGNDGSGSGLDADLLDGADASWFANIPARLGYTPVRQGGGAGQGTNTVYIGWSGTRVKLQVDSTDMGNMVFDSQIADVWRSSNDGSGSGLDADLLDGYQGSDYVRVVASSLVENGGYRKYSDGYIECWGYADIPANTPTMTINLPIAHTEWVNATLSGGLAIANADENYAAVTGIVGSPPTGFTVSASYAVGHRFYWNTRGK